MQKGIYKCIQICLETNNFWKNPNRILRDLTSFLGFARLELFIRVRQRCQALPKPFDGFILYLATRKNDLNVFQASHPKPITLTTNNYFAAP